MIDLFVDFKLRMAFEVFPNRRLGIVSWAPGAVGEHVFGHVFDNGVEHNAVAADAGERGIGLQLG